jgi:hypothetical protein
MNVANRVLWRMMIILKANKVYLFVSSVLFVFWYHSPNVLDTPHICNISRLRVQSTKYVAFREMSVEWHDWWNKFWVIKITLIFRLRLPLINRTLAWSKRLSPCCMLTMVILVHSKNTPMLPIAITTTHNQHDRQTCQNSIHLVNPENKRAHLFMQVLLFYKILSKTHYLN